MNVQIISDRIGKGAVFLALFMGCSVGINAGQALIDGRTVVRANSAYAEPGSISLRSTEPLRVSSAHAVTIPFAGEN